jgi:MFS family permease
MQTILISDTSKRIPARSLRPVNASQLSWAVGPLGLSQSALLVYLPLLVSNTQLGYGEWAQLFAMGMGFYLLGTILWPLLIPRLGHRSALLWGLAGFSISMVLFWFMLWSTHAGWLSPLHSFTGLAFSRMVYGIFASALLPVTQSWCANVSRPEQRLSAFSAISLQLSLGRALGPVLAVIGLWLHWLALPLILALWPCFIAARLLNADEGKPLSPAPANKTIPLPPLWLALIAIATTAFASSLQFQASPVLERLLNAPAQQISQHLAWLMIAAALLSVIAHRLQVRYPPPQPLVRILWIASLLIVSALCFLRCDNVWLFYGLILVISMGLAWLTPLYGSQFSLAHTRQHTAAAQLGVMHILGHIGGLSVTAAFLQWSLSGLYIWLAMLGFIIAIAGVSLQRE